MPENPTRPGHRLRRAAFQVFYRLPARWRRRLVRHLKPRFTVGSVMLVYADDQLLLVRQPGSDGWSLPAGLMNRGEQPIECAVRELAEETGVRVTVADVEPAHPNAVVNKGWIDCVFITRVPPGTDVAVDGEEVHEGGFFPVGALPPLSVPTARLLGNYGVGPYADYPETRS